MVQCGVGRQGTVMLNCRNKATKHIKRHKLCHIVHIKHSQCEAELTMMQRYGKLLGDKLWQDSEVHTPH